nr:hypothetical protein [Tanacetum cinerariifolium]
MAGKSISPTKWQEDKVAEDASNKKKWEGTDDEDAHEHMRRGRALRWKKRLPTKVINTWDLLEKEFIYQHLTIEQYLTLIQDNNRPGIVMSKIGNDVEFEIYSNFMRELRCKLFTGEKFKARTTMGKENMKESVPRDLPPRPFLRHLKEQIGSPYRTRETICMIENPREVYKMKAREDEGDIDVDWDITVKDVPAARRKILRLSRLVIVW